MLVAPEIPIGRFLGLGRSSVSLGFVGFVIWSLLCPQRLLRLRLRKKLSWSSLWLLFVLHAWLVSVFSLRAISFLYASQYLVYTFFAILILRGYLSHAFKFGEFCMVLKIVTFVGVVYAIGTLLSLFIGPIYAYQTHWVNRLLQDESSFFLVPRGTGFGDNPNSVGGILVFLLNSALFSFFMRCVRYRLLPVIIGAALISTFSRSAILSFVFALCFLVFVLSLRGLLWNPKFSCRKLLRLGTLVYILGLVTLATLVIFGQKVGKFGYYAGLDIVLLREDIVTRLGIWKEGLKSFIMRESFVQLLFGVGFRGSMVMSQYGTWVTPHNFFIAVLNDFGIVGFFVVTLTFLGTIFGVVFRLLTCSREKIALFSFLLLVLTALLAHNLSEVFLYSPAYLFLFLFLIFSLEESAKFCVREEQH